MPSRVIAYLEDVYSQTNSVGGDSWRNLSYTMGKAMKLAIEGRFKFEPDDFIELARPGEDKPRLGWAYWCGGDGEHFYSLAVKVPNQSAAIAFEKLKDRKPFIWQGKRLAVGSDFFAWEGEPPTQKLAIEWGADGGIRWYVTSFAPDGSYINCCSYHTEGNPKGWKDNVRQPTARKKFTVKDLKEQDRKIKAAREAEKAKVEATPF